MYGDGKDVYIEIYKKFKKVNYYSIRFEGEEKNETVKLLERFHNDEKYKRDLQKILKWIKKSGELGVSKVRFENNAVAIPFESCGLRLYGIKCTSEIVILDGGGIKTSQKVQDSPDVYPKFKLMNELDRLFREKLNEREIYYNWDNNTLEGDLKIERI